MPDEANRQPDMDALLDLAQDVLEQGDPSRALYFCAQALEINDEHPGALYLEADVYRELNELEQAETTFRRLLTLYPEHSLGWRALGSVLFDLFDLEAAETCFRTALRHDPRNPEAYWGRALLRERRNDSEGAARDYTRANRHGGDAWPIPGRLSDEELLQWLNTAMSPLHEGIQAYLGHIPILILEMPDPHSCDRYVPPASPAELLGHFSAINNDFATPIPWGQLPSCLVLYRQNLQRLVHTPDQMVFELRNSVLTEVGLYLGIPSDAFITPSSRIPSTPDAVP